MAARRLSVRPMVWVLHLALPVAGVWLLVARPALDGVWENHAAHFWLVLGTAAINVVLAAVMNAESARRSDIRLFLVSLAFAVSAGFLGLHALATPGVLLAGNTGFVIATPVGLLVGSALCAWSAVEFSPRGAARLLAARRPLRVFVVTLLVGWLALSLARVPLLARPLTPAEAHGPLVVLMALGALLYGFAALRYWGILRRRPAVMLISVITAFALLAEAMVAVAYARNWHASWWEWHLLMTIAFGFVGYSAYVQWGREGSPTGLFGGIALTQTVRSLREDYGAALEALVEVMDHATDRSVEPIAARVADRFGLTERQRDVLVRAAQALAAERDQIRRQGALVAVGREASVITTEDDLLARVQEVTRASFGRDELRIWLLRDGRLDSSGSASGVAATALARLRVAEEYDGVGSVLALPLTVKSKPAGVLEVTRPGPFADRDRALLASFASQLSIALENARLYRQLDGLFRSYISPDVATSLLADPEAAALGGAVAEVTVLLADLRGFTPFAERTSPTQVVATLNTYYGLVVPIVLAEGGTVVQFVGDAIMAIFNAPVRQPDHALRAARAALHAQRATAEAAAPHPDWPRFRMGINTGPALVGNVGSEQMRNFTAIGDTTNLTARLEAAAGVGEVVISETTLGQLGDCAVVHNLGPLALKGKSSPITAYRLIALLP
jgi:class 3 adenylate cyclase